MPKKSVKSRTKSVRKVGASKKSSYSSKSLVIVSLVVLGLGATFVIAKHYGVKQADIYMVGTPYTPKDRVSDNFADSSINTNKWSVQAPVGVRVAENAGDNLIIAISPIAATTGYKSGGVTMKEKVDAGQDFVFKASLFKPIVSGTGLATEGIKFVASGKNDDESVALSWKYLNGKYFLTYGVTGSDGAAVESGSLEFNKAKTTLRITRVGTSYRFWYLDNLSDEVDGWALLGEASAPNLDGEGKSPDGHVGIFARSRKEGGKYLSVRARVDNAALTWPNPANGVRAYFSDTFAPGTLKGGWSATGTPTLSGGNLFLNVDGGKSAAGGKRLQSVTLTQLMGVDKPSAATVELLRPVGGGASGVGFKSKGGKDDEGAAVKWTGDRLVFIVRNDKGAQVERQAVTVPAGIKRVTVQLSRNKDVYSARYMFGSADGDKQFKLLGKETLKQLGTAGYFYLMADNAGPGDTFPATKAGFDEFAVYYDNNLKD